MMGVKVLLLVIVTFFSCDNSKKSTNQASSDMNSIYNLIGKWYISSQENNSIVSKCNVCPEIEFADNGEGKITKPSKEEINFTYTLVSDSKKVEFFFEVGQPYFDEKEYLYKIHIENNLEILELSSKDGTSKYILSRKE
ncbi:MAG: hypothetical protein LBQ84_00230 [Flavobacteriaceae bacterium]|nr:hypothetical protein [Flavobacteriaceae bacterium]